MSPTSLHCCEGTEKKVSQELWVPHHVTREQEPVISCMQKTAGTPPPHPGPCTHIVEVCLELVCAEYREAVTQSVGLPQDLMVKGDLA